LVQNSVPLGISWTAVVVAILIPSGIGVLFGYLPAAEAAKLNPVAALQID
jgi:ABC-type antimicrobial peptide transport system permease subunit